MSSLRTFLRGILGLCVLGLAGWVLTGCETTGGSEAVDVAPPATIHPTDIIQPGEQLSILVKLLTTEVNPQPVEQKVKPDGTINLEWIGNVPAAGKTVQQLEKEIQEAYVPKWYKRCTVNIKQTDRFFFVDGQVKMPNRFVYVSEITVSGALATAGGPTDFANKKVVQITRANGKVETVNIMKALKNPKLDLVIFPGDRIYVPRRLM